MRIRDGFAVGTLVSAISLLSACSGGSASPGTGSSSSSSSGGSSGTISKSCTEQFNPDMAAAGADCTPTYHASCPPPDPSLPLNSQEVTPCDGVAVSNGSVTAMGETASYVVLEPTATPVTVATALKPATTSDSSAGRVIYIALHGTSYNGPTFANRMRMAELAKSRKVTVVAPTAPGLANSWGYSVLPPISTADSRIALIDALIAAVTGATPPMAAGGPAVVPANTKIIIGGISGGGVMALHYSCARPEVVSGAIVVAAELSPADLAACSSGGFPTVQVNGTSDLLAAYNAVPGYAAGAEPTFQKLAASNGCDTAKLKSATLPVPADEQSFIKGIKLQYVSDCVSGKGSALVTIDGGGHNWPGYDRALDVPPGVNAYGPISMGFDATLQAYDLVRNLDR